MSDDNIIRLVPDSIAEGERLDGDAVLEGAKGNKWLTLMICGQLEDGTLVWSSTAGMGESLILLELVKHEYVIEGSNA